MLRFLSFQDVVIIKHLPHQPFKTDSYINESNAGVFQACWKKTIQEKKSRTG